MKHIKKGNKLITSAIACVLTAALVLTGTFAWVQLASRANEWRYEDEDGTPGGTGHDDFCQPNKDVYVENWGEKDIFVRIRLDEYMETGEGAGKYLGSNLTTQEQDPDNKAVSSLPGALIYDRTTWEPHVPHNGSAAECGTAADFHDCWTWSMGGQKWYMPAPSLERTQNGYVAGDTAVYTAADAVLGAKQTLPGIVITMQKWREIGKPIGQNYWVIDTDGWAYWAQPLEGGTATGLLLDAVQLVSPINGSYYYAINVLYQMATRTNDDGSGDYNDFGAGGDKDHTWTDEGHDLMDTVTGNGGGSGGVGVWGEDNGVTIDPQAPFANAKIDHRIFIPQGGTVTLKAAVTDLNAGTDVTWVEQPVKTGFTFTDTDPNDDLADVTIAANVPAGTTYPVRAEAADDPAYYSTKTVVVIPAGSAIVDGGNGRVFIDYGDNTFREIFDNGTIGGLFCGGEDEIPGNADDRDDVVLIGGDKVLPSLPGDLNNKGAHGGEAGWYWTKGPDGKLGTADDAETDLGATNPQTPTIASLAVAPLNVTLAPGSSQQFTATATMSDGAARQLPNSQITWEISPAPSSASTVIASDGRLTLGADETQGSTLYVYATLKSNTAICNSATVSVPRPSLPNLKDVPVGGIVNMDGIDMIKLFDANNILFPNFALFMTAENFQALGVFNTDVNKLDYPTSTMKDAIDAWFAALPQNGDIRSRISPPNQLQTDPNYYSISLPTANTYGHTSQTVGMAFAPNDGELRAYTQLWYRAQGTKDPGAPGSYRETVPGANFWLRTYAGFSQNGQLAYIFSTDYGTTTKYINYPDVAGYRACVWLYVGS